MTKRSAIILICIAFLAGAGAGGAVMWKISKCPDVLQNPPEAPQHKDIKIPETDEEIKDALQHEIMIAAKQKSNLFHVEATNGYKWTAQDFPLTFPKPPAYHHTIQLVYGYIYNIEAKEFRHNLEGLYFYSWGHIGIGGGAMVTFLNGKVYDAGPRLGAQVRI